MLEIASRHTRRRWETCRVIGKILGVRGSHLQKEAKPRRRIIIGTQGVSLFFSSLFLALYLLCLALPEDSSLLLRPQPAGPDFSVGLCVLT